jgi:hypothetical protein
MRRLIIGQPAPLTLPTKPLGARLATAGGELQVIRTPGHSDDHVSFYDPGFKLLFAGDSFMGSYFSSPNPDVDSLIWIQTLERLLEVGVEILAEGHGHIHTLSSEIPDIPDVVIRQAPEAELKAKLGFFHWIRQQVVTGQAEGMPASAIAAGRNWFGASSDGPTARSCRSTRWSLASNCQVPNVTAKPDSRHPGDESEVAQECASGPGRLSRCGLRTKDEDTANNPIAAGLGKPHRIRG